MVKSCVIHPNKHPINSQEKPQQQEKARRHYSLEKKNVKSILMKIKYFITLLKEKTFLRHRRKAELALYKIL